MEAAGRRDRKVTSSLRPANNRFSGVRQQCTRYHQAQTFKSPGPFIEPAFWALRMFDATNYYPVANPISLYVLGSDYPDMKKNADGSLTIYMSKAIPASDGAMAGCFAPPWQECLNSPQRETHDPAPVGHGPADPWPADPAVRGGCHAGIARLCGRNAMDPRRHVPDGIG
ncbi:DUF1214 domain-containing protein [Synechococcus sp. RedBA-s]|uniref:DUF1214 domain-containing protein n=1 Tax=Synechococcus sp. RedBA-s TaxID=2823741 RepID=UPI0037D9948B